jgi:hypothetical protein
MREALKHHLAQLRFDQLRRRVMPFAEARGYLTDEDVFKSVSLGSSPIPTCSQARSARAGCAPM